MNWGIKESEKISKSPIVIIACIFNAVDRLRKQQQ